MPDEKNAADNFDNSIGEAARQSHFLIVVLTAIYVVALVDRFLIALIIDPIKGDLHLTDVQVSLMIGLAFSLFYGIFSIPAGFLADRVGRRGMIGTAAFGWSAMTALCGLATGFFQFFLARAGVGVAEACITPTALSLIRDRVPPRLRGRAFSVFAMGPNVGGAIALSGGGVLLGAASHGAFHGLPLIGELHAWQVLLVLVGMIGMIPILPLLWVVPDRRDFAPSADPPDSATILGAYRHMRSKLVLYAPLLGYVTFSAMLAFGVNAWMPSMISRKFGVSLAQVGAVSGPITLVAAVSGLSLCGYLIDRFADDVRKILLLGKALAICAILAGTLMPQVENLRITWLFYGAVVFFMGSFYPVGVSVLVRFTPNKIMGKVMAIYLIFQSSLGGALAPSTVAAIARFFDGPRAIAYGLSIHCAIAGGIGLLLCMHLSRLVRVSGEY